MLHWLVEDKNIVPHVPVWEKSERDDESLSRSDFEWIAEANEYRCPTGKPLKMNWRDFKTPRTHVTKADTIIYRASKKDCDYCPLKPKYCPNIPLCVKLRLRGFSGAQDEFLLAATAQNLRRMAMWLAPEMQKIS